MSGTTHVAAGVLIAQSTGNPGLGFLLGVASHVAMDTIPHEEFFSWKVEFVLVLILIGFVTFFTYPPSTVLLLTILGAVGPDLEIVLWKSGALTRNQLLFPTHSGLIPQGQSDSMIYALLQVAIIGTGIGVILSHYLL